MFAPAATGRAHGAGRGRTWADSAATAARAPHLAQAAESPKPLLRYGPSRELASFLQGEGFGLPLFSTVGSVSTSPGLSASWEVEHEDFRDQQAYQYRWLKNPITDILYVQFRQCRNVDLSFNSVSILSQRLLLLCKSSGQKSWRHSYSKACRWTSCRMQHSSCKLFTFPIFPAFKARIQQCKHLAWLPAQHRQKSPPAMAGWARSTSQKITTFRRWIPFTACSLDNCVYHSDCKHNSKFWFCWLQLRGTVILCSFCLFKLPKCKCN